MFACRALGAVTGVYMCARMTNEEQRFMVLLLLCSMLSHPMSIEVSVSLTPKQYFPVSSAISSKYLRPPPQ